jgi:hypothetical protein
MRFVVTVVDPSESPGLCGSSRLEAAMAYAIGVDFNCTIHFIARAHPNTAIIKFSSAICLLLSERELIFPHHALLHAARWSINLYGSELDRFRLALNCECA